MNETRKKIKIKSNSGVLEKQNGYILSEIDKENSILK